MGKVRKGTVPVQSPKPEVKPRPEKPTVNESPVLTVGTSFNAGPYKDFWCVGILMASTFLP